jgi:ABC-type transport system substrate-binding protein
VARLTALTAALAVSLLAVSGAGGVGAQTPRKGGTVAIVPQAGGEPVCLNPVISSCAVNTLTSVLYGAFAVGPDLSVRPKLVSHVHFTTKPPFTLTYRIRPEARWSDGLPIAARDFVFTHKAIRKYSAPGFDVGHRTWVRRVRIIDVKTFEVVLRSRFAGWRNLFPVVLPEHALRAEDLARVWIDRIDNPKTGRPIGSGPFLVGGVGPRRATDLCSQPELLGSAPCLPRSHHHQL